MQKKRRISVFLKTLLLAVLIILPLGAACAVPSQPTSTPATVPMEILVGTSAPLTGALSTGGEGSEFGTKAAIDDINAQGGIFVKEYNRKLPVRQVLVNNESDSIKAGSLAEDMILRDKVDFLLSGIDIPPSVASIAGKAEKYKIPYVCSPGPVEPYMAMRMSATPPWQYTWASGFRIATPPPAGDYREGKPGYTVIDLGAVLIQKFAGQTNKKIAIYASDDADGRGWYSLFAAELKKMGLDVIGADKELGLVPPETTDFSGVIQQWKNSNCELLWGNAPGPFIGTLWRQSIALGFKPKMHYASKGSISYADIIAWGGDLPNGVGTELLWHPALKGCPGIGTTTPQSLYDRWNKATKQPLNQFVGVGYHTAQILFDAIERAGTLDKDKVNDALANTDLNTVCARVVFEKDTHFNSLPLAWAQWFKTDQPTKWNMEIVVSPHDFLPPTAQPLFPIPYQ